MNEVQASTRSEVMRLFGDLARGHGSPFRESCSSDVTWWLPLGPDSEHRGPADVERALIACLGAGDVVLESVVVAEDGSTAVVEQLIGRLGAAPTPATSLIALTGGVVTAGRTYVDLAAWEGRDEGGWHVEH